MLEKDSWLYLRHSASLSLPIEAEDQCFVHLLSYQLATQLKSVSSFDSNMEKRLRCRRLKSTQDQQTLGQYENATVLLLCTDTSV